MVLGGSFFPSILAMFSNGVRPLTLRFTQQSNLLLLFYTALVPIVL